MSVSIAQRKAVAIAEHHPEQLYERNKGLLGMTHAQMHEFASTPEKGLPYKKGEAKKKKPRRGHKGGLLGYRGKRG